MDIGPERRPARHRRRGASPVYLADLWPSEEEVAEAIRASLDSEMFRPRYGSVFDGDDAGGRAVAEGETFAWDGRRPTC